jgi:hypothetical protein
LVALGMIPHFNELFDDLAPTGRPRALVDSTITLKAYQSKREGRIRASPIRRICSAGIQSRQNP